MARRESWGSRTNRAVGGATARVDGQTEAAAHRAASVLVPAVRLLRVPTLVVLVAPLPFEVAIAVLGFSAGGGVGTALVVVALLLGLVSAAFAGRRHRVLRAVDDPEGLATELGIAVSLSDKVDETRGALTAIAGGGGWRVLSRAKGVWGGIGMTGRWIEGVGDLPRARYFLPPKIGTSVTVTVAALWLVPISVLLTFFAVVAAIAGSL